MRAASLRRMTAAVAVLVEVTIGGCATPARELVLDARSEAAAPQLWPGSQSGEVPRYRYVGQLTGEGDFHAKTDTTAADSMYRIFRAIVGLDERIRDPVVLQRPQSGYTDASGRVLVTDVSRKAVFVFDPVAGKLSVWDRATADEPFATPIAIAPGANGEWLVTDAERAEVVRLAANGEPRGRFGHGVLARPTGIVRDAAAARTYVADTWGHDIKVFADDGTLVDTIGRRGDGSVEFNYPSHLALANGTLYVADTLNARIVAIGAGGQSRAFGRRGLYVGDFVRPKGVAVDDEGNVYVVESMHDSLVVFDNDAHLLMAIGGTGRDVGRFFLPAGVWLDARNRVFVADMFNGRVVVFQFLGGS